MQFELDRGVQGASLGCQSRVVQPKVSVDRLKKLTPRWASMDKWIKETTPTGTESGALRARVGGIREESAMTTGWYFAGYIRLSGAGHCPSGGIRAFAQGRAERPDGSSAHSGVSVPSSSRATRWRPESSTLRTGPTLVRRLEKAVRRVSRHQTSQRRPRATLAPTRKRSEA